jgi:hypothetical protein
MSTITKLPAPSKPYQGELPSGTVVLYRDDNWGSQSYRIDCNDYVPNQRQSFSGRPIQDAATWVAFNLPEGTVMTLLDNDAPPGKNGCCDLSKAGRVVDLVGTGRTEAVDLKQVNMNDCASAFFWRPVDLLMGAIELYEDQDFKGNRTVLFLSEWPSSKAASLSGWYIEDRLSSAKWDTLRDVQYAQLFQNSDGTGKQYGNIKGYGTLEDPNFKNAGFGDVLSAFRWDAITPEKEEVQKFDVKVNVVGDARSATLVYDNPTRQDQSYSMSLSETDSETITVTASNTFAVGTKITATNKWTEGSALFGGAETSVAIETSFQYTRSDTDSKSSTHTTTSAVTQSINAKPGDKGTAVLIATMGNLPPTTYTTTAKRWYKQNFPGTERDPGTNLYVRTETITGVISGKMSLNARIENHPA